MPVSGRSVSSEPCAWRWVTWLLAGACGVVLAMKFWLIPRQNINWDEFLFLSQLYAAMRGDLAYGLQTSYTHLFLWLPGVDGDEIDQIRAARVLMTALLGVSALLIQKLASRWLAASAAWAAALAFLAMWPTMKHGGSFRADSLLLPLLLGALLMLTHPTFSDRKRGLGAGVLLGAAVAVSVKAVLLAPVVIALCAGGPGGRRGRLLCMVWLSCAAALVAGVLVGAHLLSIPGQGAVAAAGEAAGNAWHKTLGSGTWFPQAGTLREMLQEDAVFWMAAAIGTAWAVWRRLWLVAACALALLPIAFYRNSFAYYYVVMWGPACVTIAAAIAGAQELVARSARPSMAIAATLALSGLLMAQGLRDVPYLSHPRQEDQRQLVDAVHAIFPDPVPYIDHSGMIGSFRKVNFFMSTWGVQTYLARDRPFMPIALSRFRPPMLIANRAELLPGTGSFAMLLPEDRRLIETNYLPYWGPIRIAGASAALNGLQTQVLEFPFGGEYRLATPAPARVDGTVVQPDGHIVVSDSRLVLPVATVDASATASQAEIRFVWAAARPPPADRPVSSDYYDDL